MNTNVLEEINYTDIPYNYFNEWLTETLYYQCNIVFDEHFIKDDNGDYKELFYTKDITLQFREENNYNDDFDIAVYCKKKGQDEWEYVDNITRELYARRYEK